MQLLSEIIHENTFFLKYHKVIRLIKNVSVSKKYDKYLTSTKMTSQRTHNVELNNPTNIMSLKVCNSNKFHFFAIVASLKA